MIADEMNDLLCKLGEDILSRVTAFLGRHNHLRRDNLIPVENHHIQTSVEDHSIVLDKFNDIN
jgi:hypothetical protein